MQSIILTTETQRALRYTENSLVLLIEVSALVVN